MNNYKSKNKTQDGRLNKKGEIMKLLSLVSKGNRIAKVRTYGAAGFMIELTELKVEAGEVSKRHYSRLYKKFNTSIRGAQQWVNLATE